jgi:cob(I)alamin adenosyltransferase
MKIYTRKGDKGTTGLLGGTRVPKHHLRIEAYGTMDELNAWLGVIVTGAGVEKEADLLVRLQSEIFTLGSHLAADPEKNQFALPALKPELVDEMEAAIDRMDEELEPLKNFILPGGNRDAAFSHVARTVCRRAERCLTALAESAEVPSEAIAFLNRLSDFLFALGRVIAKRTGAEEREWRA